MDVRVAVAQMDCRLGDVRTNLRQIGYLAQKIGKRDVDIVCFPELVTTGYSLNEKWVELAETIPGETTGRLSSIAEEFGLYLVVGMAERDLESDRTFNSAVLMGPKGEVAGVYRKVHLWGAEKRFFSPGDGFPTFKTKIGVVGMAICYDLEFPESTRILTLRGAQIVFYPSAEWKPFETLIETYVKSRAAENVVYAGFSNRIGREGEAVFFGHSRIVSPDCRTLARAGSASEAFAIARIDLADLSKKRKKLPYLEDRVPNAYRMLQSSKPRSQT